MSLTVDPAKQFFRNVIREVDRSQVDLKMTSMGYGHVWIDLIQVHDGMEGLGIGGRMLDQLCTIADNMGMTLKLKAITCKPWVFGQNQLECFYEKRGFVIVRRAMYTDAPTMERIPACMQLLAA